MSHGATASFILQSQGFVAVMLGYSSVETFSPHPELLRPQRFTVLFSAPYLSSSAMALPSLIFLCVVSLFTVLISPVIFYPPFHTIIFFLLGHLIPILLQQFITALIRQETAESFDLPSLIRLTIIIIPKHSLPPPTEPQPVYAYSS